MKRTVFVIWLLACVCTVRTDNFTYSYKDAMRCKEHICRHGYSYETFYRVDANEMRSINVDPHSVFEMHIAIQAASNGHIVLSEIPNPGVSDPVYEIVVGGGGNKFTELRRNLRRNAKSSVTTPQILSPIELRGFYIKISEDGLVEFGREGQVLPLISFNDVDPLSVKYFSFAAWNGVEAKFLYDCPIPGDTSIEDIPNSHPEEPKLTPTDKLKRTLLMGRLPSVPPNPVMEVKLGFKLTSFRYNTLDSKLTTTAAVVVSWEDDSMAWNPDKFNGTTNIKLRQGQIWKPSFYVLNSDGYGAMDSTNPDTISLASSGEATLHFQTQTQNYCFDTTTTYSRWPHDVYQCLIVIEPWEAHENIKIEILDETDARFEMFSDIDTVIHNEWQIMTEQVTLDSAMWNEIIDLINSEEVLTTHLSDKMIITVDLAKNPDLYNLVFYVPMLVLNTFVLISFWTEPLTMSRIWFYVACVVSICFGLCYIDYLIPIHAIPTIMVLYVTVLFGLMTAVMANVLLISNFGEALGKSSAMKQVLTCGVVRAVFCLPSMKKAANGDYSVQEDDDSSYTVDSREGVEEMERSDKEIKYGDKAELAVVVDKILFVVYLTVFVGMLAAHY